MPARSSPSLHWSAAPSPVTLGLALWLALAAPGVAQTPPAGPPDTRRVDVFYTGFTGGLSSGHVDFAELRPLFRRDLHRDFEVSGFVSDNVFRRGNFLLYTNAGPLTLDDFQTFFATGPITSTKVGPCDYLATDFCYVLAPTDGWSVGWLLSSLLAEGGFSDAHRVQGRRYRLTNADGVHLELVGLGTDPPPADLWDDPTRWEMLPAGSVRLNRDEQRSMLVAIGRPFGDGLRRAKLLMAMRHETPGPSLTVDVGNLLDPGYTQLSLNQREFTLLRLHELAYDAIVPAETELSLSNAEWDRLRSLVPIVAANLKPRDPALLAPPPHLIKTLHGLKVALVGLVDDHALELHGVTGPNSAWQATDAVTAARKEIEALAPENPDVVLILTNVRDGRMDDLRQLQGVTAVLGDFRGLPGDVFKERVDVSGPRRARSLNTYMIAKASPNRVGRFTAEYEAQPGQRAEMRSLRNEAHLVTDELDEDDAWRWQLNVTLDRYQSARRGFLLPDLRDAASACPADKLLPDGGLPAFDKGLWARFVANVLRDATRSEVAITRALPISRTLIGPVSRLAIENWLDVGDHIVTTQLCGKALKKLAADDATAKLLTFSGYDPRSQKVMGFDLDDDENYRVVTTDAVAHHALYEDVFEKCPLDDRWQVAADGTAANSRSGKPLMLRELVLDALVGLKQAFGDAFTPRYMAAYGKLLEPTGARVEPRWVVDLEDGELLLNGYQNRGSAAYNQVLDPRVTTPDSLSLGGKGKANVIYDSRDWAWDNGAKAIYKRTSLNQNGTDVSQKSDDEIDLTSELRLKLLRPAWPDDWSPIPFLNAGYTTQFTPDDPGSDGVRKPRRSELNAAAGWVIQPSWGLKQFRVGAALKDDLARPGYLEPGALVAADFERKLELLPLTLKAGLDATHYFPTPTDGPDRLGWRVDLTGGLSVPLWERFTLNLNADYFAYQGKVPATSAWGSSLDFKIGLGYSLAFKPFYGVLY